MTENKIKCDYCKKYYNKKECMIANGRCMCQRCVEKIARKNQRGYSQLGYK